MTIVIGATIMRVVVVCIRRDFPYHTGAISLGHL